MKTKLLFFNCIEFWRKFSNYLTFQNFIEQSLWFPSIPQILLYAVWIQIVSSNVLLGGAIRLWIHRDVGPHRKSSHWRMSWKGIVVSLACLSVCHVRLSLASSLCFLVHDVEHLLFQAPISGCPLPILYLNLQNSVPK